MSSIRRDRGHVRSYSVRNRPTPSAFQHQPAGGPGPLPSNHISRLHPAYQRGHSWHNAERVPSAGSHHRQPGGQGFGGEDGDGGPTSARNLQFKTCCRSITTFMCTQVGVGGIIVCYALLGAFMFIALETTGNPHGNDQVHAISRLRNMTALTLLQHWNELQWKEEEWQEAANSTLRSFQNEIVAAFKKGYDGRLVEEKWTFPSALMFTLSIFTMIGYGNLVPRTEWGKVITMFYAVFGIPLYVLYFLNMGRALSKAFKWVYIKLSSCQLRRSAAKNSGEEYLGPPPAIKHSGPGSATTSKDSSVVVVPSTASIYVLIAYIAVGTIMFAEWEGWEYLDSVYFCVISLCKIGLGDFVPGTNIQEELESNQTKLIINFVYLLLGLGLVAMCYNLLKEEVLAKVKELRADIRYMFGYVRNECGHCTESHEHIPPPGIVSKKRAQV